MKKEIASVLFLCCVLDAVFALAQSARWLRRPVVSPRAYDTISQVVPANNTTNKVGRDSVLNCVNVPLTGFNYDVVADGMTNDPRSTITYEPYKGLDDVDYVFTSEDFIYNGTRPAYFLPSDRKINSSRVVGLNFLLAPYNAKNVLLLHNNKGTLDFVTPVSGKNLYILGTTGSGDADVTFSINYFDGSSQQVAPQLFPDWFRSTEDYIVGERFNVKENCFYVIYNNPGLSSVKLKIADSKKKIKGISASSHSGYFALMAISIEQ